MFNILRLSLPEVLQSPRLLKFEKFPLQATCSMRSAPESSTAAKREPAVDPEVRFKYPEFLPHPYIKWRNPIREKLERADMLKRRKHLQIPEFYVGSILSVTTSSPHAPQKTTRFVGICILREGTGLTASFMLRNIVDHQGIDIIYEMYDPKIQKIEVLRLEKRLDKDLLYLRDAEPQYSTFPFDMEPEYLPEGTPVPVNPIKVVLKPRPWRARYEIKDYLGIEPFPLGWRRARSARRVHKIPTKYDLMWQYRNAIPEEEQREIYAEVCSQLQETDIKKKKIKRKSEFVPPTKVA